MAIYAGLNITGADGLTHYWKSKRTWLEGESTLTSFDDIYEITGNAEGTSRKGISYTVSIISPLRVDLSCEWRIEVTLTVNGRSKTFNRTK
jgi:hypothetical protein